MHSSCKAALAAVFCSSLLGTPALAQAPPSHRPASGPANAAAQTSAKREVSEPAAAAAAAAATQTSGTLVAKFAIKLVTPVPSGYEVLCGLTASVADENTSTYTIANNIYENASTKATISGATATCTVSIPYSWYLTYAATDKVDLSYTLYIINGAATNGAGEARSSSQYVPGAGAIAVPANGATTTYTVAATL